MTPLASAPTEEEEISVIALPLTEEDKRLQALFAKLEEASLETLESAARQLITLSTTLLSAFFGLLAFKDAPPYLQFPEIKALGSLALGSFFVALLFALNAVLPRRYDVPQASLSAKRALLEKLLGHKYHALRWAVGIFALGALLLLAAALDILLMRL